MMMSLLLSRVLVSLVLSTVVTHGAYTKIASDFRGANFFDNFDFFTGADPTHGHVQYLNRNDAQNLGIIKATNQNIYIGVDRSFSAPSGRRSVRIESKQRYTRGLFILDLAHMPVGCGTWPAYWTLGDSWPNNGEIDIIEGVHEQVGNSYALHTSDQCSVDGSGQISNVITRNCFVSAPGQGNNQGCQMHDPRSNTYGSGFNAQGGGVIAMEWNSDFIKVWNFPRNGIPGDALNGNPEPANWGTPSAKFQGACNINSHFNNHKIIFDITFCGDWAGGVWGSSGCQNRAPTCNEFVSNNPGAFAEAFWVVNSLKVWSW